MTTTKQLNERGTIIQIFRIFIFAAGIGFIEEINSLAEKAVFPLLQHSQKTTAREGDAPPHLRASMSSMPNGAAWVARVTACPMRWNGQPIGPRKADERLADRFGRSRS